VREGGENGDQRKSDSDKTKNKDTELHQEAGNTVKPGF
jgi:hypothetical protein